MTEATRRIFLATGLATGLAIGLATGSTAILSAQSANETIRVAFIGVAAKGGTAEAYPEFRKMLDRKDIDAAVIATPVNLQKEIVLAALEAGKHVYSEKPMGFAPEQCLQIVAAAKSAKGIYQAGFQLRHDPNRNAAMKYIKAGGIGKVVFLQAYRHSGGLPHDTPWLFGRTVMDNYTVIYEFPDDLRFTFSHIFFDPPKFSGIKERVFGSDAAIDLATATVIRRNGKTEQIPVLDAGQDSTYMSLAAFIGNTRGKSLPLNNAESARRSTLTALLGRKSMYEKRIVEWKEVDV
jgi:hypothetical protein